MGHHFSFPFLVITVGFLPVFTLQAQSGRLFKPLAYTKTFAMLFSSFLAITLTPVLMTIFIRGKIRPEERNFISIFLHKVYEPVARVALKLKWGVIIIAVIILSLTIFPFIKIGSEFMPPLYEGTLFYMPVTVPGASISEVSQLLQLQDKILKKIPRLPRFLEKRAGLRLLLIPLPSRCLKRLSILSPNRRLAGGDDSGKT